MRPGEQVRIRTATFADAQAIAQVHKRNGMGDLDVVFWRSRWEAYPFAAEFRDIPIGWVLETEDRSIVGILDNVHMLYELEGKRLKGAITSGWAVDPAYRGKSLQLMTTSLRQKGVDLWMDTSANLAASQILTAMKIPRIPIPDYGAPCFWAVRPRAFAQAALVRKAIPGAALLAWPAGLALLTRDIFRGSGRGRQKSTVRRIREFDDRFEGFWRNISTGSKRLRAVRTRAVLEWRFRADLPSGGGVIVVAEQGATLLGYAVLVHREGSELGMSLYDVADLQAERDDPSIIRDLLLGCINIAREDGVDAVKFMSGTPAKRAPADSLLPYTYRLPLWQQYFRASSELSAQLSTPDAWDFSYFDSH